MTAEERREDRRAGDPVEAVPVVEHVDEHRAGTVAEVGEGDLDPARRGDMPALVGDSQQGGLG